ncbi:enoyl-CoA hydratase [Azospirillum lipoferum]|uniref:enoyl-CoA hydratase n=1 Tax=Azospirillum lipoferum TaxID=193 RepID=A0A5A9GQB3_AZOLI|nr:MULTISPECIES: enoyl-CoA hydratase-related protein [Azospirillum]KAA0595955.1 enoyl-CoA hydratase [Azospirillum lipoferum]MCP1610850.1 enoyl-CoA hydratase [Azospirillum lipoferum]MDW5534002.1 enoyl-CoA hydratase-related protein [Azospirillum sp. NL1]
MSANLTPVRRTTRQTATTELEQDTSTAQTPSDDTRSTILVERRERVGLITLNRPKSLNALNRRLAAEVLAALHEFDADDRIGAIVITGSMRAFAAGADIAEMVDKTFVELNADDILSDWDQVRFIKKPIIAAVGGYALGGGCELALLCDFIVASEDAQFGQPEIKLGILPGIGGSQRLTHSAGKALAMDLVLTGRTIGATEAKAAGIVARVVPAGDLLQTALEAAHTIAGYNAPAVRMAKEAVNRAFEASLAEGLMHERRLFQAAFATEGQKEGMHAFLAKRAPVFRNR